MSDPPGHPHAPGGSAPDHPRAVGVCLSSTEASLRVWPFPHANVRGRGPSSGDGPETDGAEVTTFAGDLRECRAPRFSTER